MDNLSFAVNSVSAFDTMTQAKKAGALYFAKDSHSTLGDRTYIYYHDGTKTYNIVPRKLGVSNGGTGKDTLTTNGVLYGNGTAAIGVTNEASSAGALLAANANKIPAFGVPTFSWNRNDTSNLWLNFSIHGTTFSSANIPVATYTLPGIITATAQTFGGVKTFGNGIKIAASNTTTDCATFTYDASTDTLIVSFPS